MGGFASFFSSSDETLKPGGGGTGTSRLNGLGFGTLASVLLSALLMKSTAVAGLPCKEA